MLVDCVNLCKKGVWHSHANGSETSNRIMSKGV